MRRIEWPIKPIEIVFYLKLIGSKQFLVLMVVLAHFSCISGQSVVTLTNNEFSYSLTNKLEYFVDTERNTNINDILSHKIKFQKIEKGRLNFDMSDNIYWYKFSINEISNKENKWIVEFKHALVEDICFYLVDSAGQVVNRQKGGLKYNKEQKEIVFRNPIFPITIHNAKYDIFLRIDTRSNVYTTINIYESCTFWSVEKKERSLMFLLFGILFAISILNIVLFLLTKEWSYFLLAAFLSSSIILFSSIYGYLFEFFPDLSFLLKVKSRIISYQISISFLSFFAVKFLDLKRTSKLGLKIMTVLILFYLVFFLTSITNILPVIFEYKLVIFSYPIFVFIQIVVIIIAIGKQNKSAIYYLISFGFYFFISITFLMVTLGVISGNIFTNNISIIGTTIFSLLLTIGLNEKITKLRKLQTETIQLTKDKSELAEEIEIRVKAENALRKSEAKLKEANSSKDRFFSILAHDLINPFNTLIGFSSLLKESIKDNDVGKLEKYTDIINTVSNRTFRLLENLLEWSRSQTNTIEYKPQRLNVNEAITDIISLFDDIKTKKNVQIITNFQKGVNALADFNMIKTVVRNLLSNAIKFTENGTITITTKIENNYCIVSIKDTGVGISDDVLDNLFKIDISTSTCGTDGEKGTGIGLILCKEFIDKNKGEISVKSKKAEGSTFMFSLPLYVEKNK